MQLKATQENLQRALNIVAKVAGSKTTLPIIGNVLIKAQGDQLSISATNLELAITHYLGAKIVSEGSITVPARLTQDFIASLPKGTVDLALDGQKLNISCESYKSTINGIVADDFPVLPTLSKISGWSMPADMLKNALQRVVFACSSDDSRPILGGVLFIGTEDGLKVAATDSYRLSEVTISSIKNLNLKIIIPSSALNEVLRILDGASDTVEIEYDDQQVKFSTGNSELTARQVDGIYPEYQKLIPSKFDSTAELVRDDFVRLTKSTSLFARESAGSVIVSIDSASNELTMAALASQVGNNQASASAKVTGVNAGVTLNARYLADALSAFSSKNVEFCFNGKLEPCVIRSKQEKDFVHIVMPVRS